jgi:hypothetical protein
MTTYTTTIPCTITYIHNPEERETNSEPKVEEEFELLSMNLNGIVDLSEELDAHAFARVEKSIYEFWKNLKECRDDW